MKRDGVWRPRVWFAAKHSGGAGAPSGATTSPCQELADDLGSHRPLTGKQGPAPDKRRCWRAEKRPRAARYEPYGLRFSARHPLVLRGQTKQSPGAQPRRGKETA